MMEYKGYVGHVEFDDEAGVFHGEVANTRDVITFQGETVAELRTAFRESVDDYLEFCAQRGESPDKPFSGQFITRVSPDLHRKLNAAAGRARTSLNAWVAKQLAEAARAELGGVDAAKPQDKIKAKSAVIRKQQSDTASERFEKGRLPGEVIGGRRPASSRRREDQFKTQVGAQASRINDLLLSDQRREWTIGDISERLPDIDVQAIRSHINRLASDDNYRGRFLIRVRRGVYKVNLTRPKT